MVLCAGPAFAGDRHSAPDSDGIGLLNEQQPAEGVLTGGQPTPEVLAAAAEAGYQTIVSLRPDGEIDWDEAAEVERLGMNFVSLPIAGVSDMGREAVGELEALLSDSEQKPVMIHCGSGNRVGALFAVKAFHLEGLDLEEALAVGRTAGLTQMEGAVRAVLESASE